MPLCPPTWTLTRRALLRAAALAPALGLLAPVALADQAGPEAAAPEIDPDWLAAFGHAVLGQMTRDTTETTLLSPLGLATVLAMLADGARGGTARGYAQGLGLPADAALGAVAAQWQALADPGAGVVLNGASGLWLAPDFPVDPALVARQHAALGAGLDIVDFADPAVLGRINGWFADRTAGMIPELLSDLDPGTRIVLGNALYLNARWQRAFDPDLTRPAPFAAADGSVVEVDLMQQEGRFLHRAAADHQAVILPFADPDYALAIYLPEPSGDAASLLAPGAAVTTAGGFRPASGMVELPRLDLQAGGDLTAVLRAMGVLAGADHTGLTSEPLMIDQVVQQVALRLDETGAEAAAATAAAGVRSAAERFNLRADRPFALAIRHEPSNTPLFLGAINRP